MRQAILIITDTTRRDMLSCYGLEEGMSTPNLDRLAAEGLRYNAAYTCQPVCGPARSAIFTGTFPHSNGMVTNCVPLGDNVKTLGQRLRDNGIHAAYTGKWHLDGGDYFGLGVCPDGWDPDYWYDMHNYLEELTDEQRMRSRQSETAFAEDWGQEMTYAHRCADRGIDFVRKHSSEDFFFTLSLDEPHGPCICPPPFNTMYEDFRFADRAAFHDSLENKPMMQRLWAGDAINADPESLRGPGHMLSLFLGCNSFADYEIGRFLDAVDELCPDALVIYTSDHGDMLGSHRLQTKNAAFYKEICNIPLLVRDGRSGERGVVDYPASHIDITPTILDYFSIPTPKLLEGRSMLPQIRNSSLRINDYVYTEFTRYEVDHDGFGGLQMMRSVTDGRYKLSINLMDSDELYDLESDPEEVENLIWNPDYAEIRNRLHDRLIAHMDETRDLYRGYQWLCRPWRNGKSPSWNNSACTRQRENEEYEPRQWDYDTGLPMKEAVRGKKLYDEKK